MPIKPKTKAEYDNFFMLLSAVRQRMCPCCGQTDTLLCCVGCEMARKDLTRVQAAEAKITERARNWRYARGRCSRPSYDRILQEYESRRVAA